MRSKSYCLNLESNPRKIFPGCLNKKSNFLSKNLSNLQTLILIHNDINEETQELIKNSKNLPNLTKVVFLPPKKAED